MTILTQRIHQCFCTAAMPAPASVKVARPSQAFPKSSRPYQGSPTCEALGWVRDSIPLVLSTLGSIPILYNMTIVRSVGPGPLMIAVSHGPFPTDICIVGVCIWDQLRSMCAPTNEQRGFGVYDSCEGCRQAIEQSSLYSVMKKTHC